MVAAYAATINVVIHDGPGRVVAGAAAPFINPLAMLLYGSAAGGCLLGGLLIGG